MNIEVITIGDELLLGFTVDTNGAHIARALAGAGIRVVHRTTVGDDAKAIANAVGQALVRTGAVITTGGLGPTSDDRTKDAIAGLFHRGMCFHEPIWEAFRELWRSRGYPGEPPETNKRQAMVPQGAFILENRHGTAPGIWLEDDRGRWVAMLPGVPREMRGMLADTLLPLLIERAGSGTTVVHSITLRTHGVAESKLAEMLEGIGSSTADIDVAYLPGPDGVDLRLTCSGRPLADAETLLQQSRAAFLKNIGNHVYGEGDDDLAAIVVRLAKERRVRIAVAESCTGGLLGGRLTAVPGSSAVFVGGVVAYANEVKTRELAVPESVLAKHGAVSEAAALAMAAGAQKRFGVELTIAITGIAGPDGGSAEKPVGTIWCAVDLADRARASRRVVTGDREEIRRRATQMGLAMAREALLARR